jgi:hypothetical protein
MGSAHRIYLMRVYNGRSEQAISSGLPDIQPHINKMFGAREAEIIPRDQRGSKRKWRISLEVLRGRRLAPE